MIILLVTRSEKYIRIDSIITYSGEKAIIIWDRNQKRVLKHAVEPCGSVSHNGSPSNRVRTVPNTGYTDTVMLFHIFMPLSRSSSVGL